MPNHVANEVIFRNVDDATQKRILALACNAEGEIDFEVLLPVPLNCWMGSVGQQHRQTFPDNALDWCTANWSTKGNAYQQGERVPAVQTTEDSLTLTFTTAWRPPYGWLVALYNKLRLPFEYNSLSEGEVEGRSGRFNPEVEWDEWKEVPSDAEMRKHLNVLRWGCESFPEDDQTNQEQAEVG